MSNCGIVAAAVALVLCQGDYPFRNPFSRFVHVIKEIAGQTNLPALNVVTQEARAGELGPCFALTTEEAGKPAARPGNSTREIARLTSENSKAFREASRKVRDINERARPPGRLVGRYATWLLRSMAISMATVIEVKATSDHSAIDRPRNFQPASEHRPDASNTSGQ